MSLGGSSEDAVLRLKVDTTQAKAELQKFQAETRAFGGTVASQGTAALDGFAAALGTTTMGLVAAAAAAVGVAAAIGKLASDGDMASDVFNNLRINLDAATASTGGEVTQLELARLANRAYIAELRLTSQEYGVLTGFAKRAADATGQEFGAAAEQLVQALSTGRYRALKQYGIDIDETGTKAEVAARALEVMRGRVEALGEGTETAGDAIQRMKVSLDDFYDKTAQGFSEGGAFTHLLGGMTALGGAFGDTELAAQSFGIALSTLATGPFGPLIEIVDRLDIRLVALHKALGLYAKGVAATRRYGGVAGSVEGQAAASNAMERALEGIALPGGGAAGGGGGGGGGRAERPGDRAFSLAAETRERLAAMDQASVEGRTAVEEAAAETRRALIDRDIVAFGEQSDAATIAFDRRMEENAALAEAERLSMDQRFAAMDEEEAHRARLTAEIAVYTQATLQAGFAAALQGKSAAGAVRAMLASLSQQAGQQALMELAYALACTAQSIWPPNPVAATAAGTHYAAAAAFGALALGSVLVGKAAYGSSFGTGGGGGGAGAGGGLVGVEGGAGLGGGRYEERRGVYVTVVYSPSTGGFIPDAHIRDLLDQIGQGVESGYGS